MTNAKKLQKGCERFETLEKRRRRFYTYEYRAIDGTLFSCEAGSLDACRAKRDRWIHGSARHDLDDDIAAIKEVEMPAGVR